MKRMTAAAVVAVILTQAPAAPALADLSDGPLWTARYDNGGARDSEEQGIEVALRPSGRMALVAGTSYGRGSVSPSAFVAAAHRVGTGRTVWSRRYGRATTGLRMNLLAAAALSPDGSTFYLTGSSTSSGRWKLVVIAVRARDGRVQWVNRHRWAKGSVYARDVAVGPEGADVYIAGYGRRQEAPRLHQALTLAIDAQSGTTRWVRSHGGRLDDHITTTIAVSENGRRVVVLGAFGPDDYRGVIRVYGAANGILHWRAVGPPTAPDWWDLVVVPGKEMVVALGPITIAYGLESGEQQWIWMLDEAAQVGAAAADPEGGAVYVSWMRGSPISGEPELATAALSTAVGVPIWTTSYADDESFFLHPSEMAVYTGSDRVLIAGWRVKAELEAAGRRPGDDDQLLVMLDTSTGLLTQVATLDAEGHDDRAFAVTIVPDGSRAVTTGVSTQEATRQDMLTVGWDLIGS